MCKQCDLLKSMAVTHPAAEMMLTASRTVPRQQWSSVIDDARQITKDEITPEIALNLLLAYTVACGMRPMPGMVATFAIQDDTGKHVDVDTAPPIVSTTARMVTAIVSADFLAARDAYLGFAQAHPDLVTDFLAATVERVHNQARPSKGCC